MAPARPGFSLLKSIYFTTTATPPSNTPWHWSRIAITQERPHRTRQHHRRSVTANEVTHPNANAPARTTGTKIHASSKAASSQIALRYTSRGRGGRVILHRVYPGLRREGEDSVLAHGHVVLFLADKKQGSVLCWAGGRRAKDARAKSGWRRPKERSISTFDHQISCLQHAMIFPFDFISLREWGLRRGGAPPTSP